MKIPTLALVFAALASPALASGSHAGGHDKAKVTQTIQITMKETPDGKMIFTPNRFDIRQDKTVRFVIKNAGVADHEFVFYEMKTIKNHKATMEKFPEMEHDDPNAIRLKAGETGEIVWKFTNGGTFEFACLIPGHYEAGMRGDLIVSAK